MLTQKLKKVFYTGWLFILFIPSVVWADLGISGMQDFQFSTFILGSPISGYINPCVCSDNYLYNISVRSMGSASEDPYITLNNNKLYFNTYWNDSVSSSGKREFSGSMHSISGLTTSYDCNNYNCGGSGNSYFEIYFPAENLRAAKSGTYFGVVILVLEAN